MFEESNKAVPITRVVVTTSLKEAVLRQLHDNSRHLGTRKTLEKTGKGLL